MNTTMRRAALATAGLGVAAGAVFGATEAFAASPTATLTASATASASASAAKAGTKAAACKDAKHPARCALRRKAARNRGALLKKGAHGQNTVKNSAGAYVVREWQVGKVTAISGAAVTVADGDGTTWTWTTQSATVYRIDGAAGALGGVHVGDTILVRGQQSGSANDAARITDPKQSKLVVEPGS
jgi:hypothetical protein